MSLQVWFPLTKDFRQQGNSTVNFTNINATITSGGKLGNCGNFTSGGHLYCNNFSLGSVFSIACWVKFNSFSRYSNWCIMGLKDSSTDKIQFQLGILSTDGITAQWKFNNGGNCGSIQLNTWYHICVVYDGNKAYFYENGSLIKTYTIALTTTTGYDLSINGLVSGSGFSTVGSFLLNDVRIYNHKLTPLEAKKISQGLILHYPLNRQGRGQENLLPHADDLTLWNKESGINVTWDTTKQMYKITDTTHTSSYYGIYQNIVLSANTTYTFSVEGERVDQVLTFGFKEGTSWPQNGENFTVDKKRLSITITIGDTDATCRIYLFIKPVSGGSNYGYFNLPKLEVGEIITPWCANVDDASYNSMGLSGQIEYDYSGFCNNGLKSGTFIWTSNTPKYSVSTIISDTTNQILTNINRSTANTLSPYTCAIWVNPASNNLMTIYEGLCRIGISSGSVIYDYKISSGQIDQSSAQSDAIALNTWVHLAFTYDSEGNYKIYINGALRYSTTLATLYEFNTDILFIDFIGKASDFRIYTTALSAEDIKLLYQNCVTIDANGTIRGITRNEGG